MGEKKYEHSYPEGYEHFGSIAEQIRARIKELNRQLELVNMDSQVPQKHVNQYNPPGAQRYRRSVNPERTISNLEQAKGEMEKEVLRQIDREVGAGDPDAAKQVRKATLERLHLNPFDGKGKLEMDGLNKARKNLDYSQDFMEQRKKNFKDGILRQAVNENISFEKPLAEEKQEKLQPFSIADAVSKRLSVHKFFANCDDMSRTPEIRRDGITPEMS